MQQTVELFGVQEGGSDKHTGQPRKVHRADPGRKLVLQTHGWHSSSGVGFNCGWEGGDDFSDLQFVGDLAGNANGHHAHDDSKHKGQDLGDLELDRLWSEQADERVYGGDNAENDSGCQMTRVNASKVDASNDDKDDRRGPGNNTTC